MDLRRRLANLDRLSGGTAPPAPVDTEAVRRSLSLETRTTDAGSVWVRRQRLHLPPPRTLPSLQGFFARDPGPAAEPGDLLFLDTETTGLVGGTGTLPFLVGMAWWEDNELVVEQLMLPGPGHESALLAGVAERAAGRPIVATYNGASFDLPLLRTRALLNRRVDPLADHLGWDLVVPARRLWSRRLADCRQQTVELHLGAGQRTSNEVPGAEIPAVWFAYLAGDGHSRLEGVLRHNRRDMAGMARILLEVCRIAGELQDGAATDYTDWRDAWSRGRISEQRGDMTGAAAWLRQAMAVTDEPENPRLVADALRLLKRNGDHGRAREVVEAALGGGLDESWLHREMAILCEHRLGEPETALAHALLAGDDRRVARLRRRVAGTDPQRKEMPCPG